MRGWLLLLAGMAAGVGVAGPVGGAVNPLVLKGMNERPWWNADWKWRMPIAVCETSTNNTDEIVVDAEIDLGRKASAESVRVVTPWEERVPCWAEATTGNCVRLQFKTRLRRLESRPFLVYFGNDAAKREAGPTDVRVDESKAEVVTIANGALEIDIAKDSKAHGQLSRFKATAHGAENELTTRIGGTPVQGLNFRVHVRGASECATNRIERVTATPFKAEVEVDSSFYKVKYTLYSGARQLEYECSPKRYLGVSLDTSWSPGGMGAHTEFYYQSLNGIKKAKAQREDNTDTPLWPDNNVSQWITEGWYLLRNTANGAQVGQFFETATLGGLRESGSRGRAVWVDVTSSPPHVRGKQPEGWSYRGAMFAMPGPAERVAELYRVWASPPKLLAGAVEERREIPVKRADMAKDFTANIITGFPRTAPFQNPEGWMDEYVNRARRLGCNNIGMLGVSFQSLPLDEKRFAEQMDWIHNGPYPYIKPKFTWTPEHLRQTRLKGLIKRMHERGVSVWFWGNFQFHGVMASDYRMDEECRKIDLYYAKLATELGFDGIWNGIAAGEGPFRRKAYLDKCGGDWRAWDKEHLDLFFKDIESIGRHSADYKKAVAAANPEARVICWSSENGEAGREQMNLESAEHFDIAMLELLSGPAMRTDNVRNGAARMRAMSDNKRVTTYNHFYQFRGGDDMRVGEIEMPFVYGVNGFNLEEEEYDYVDPEILGCHGDALRLLEYTGLGQAAAEMTPFKHFAVFRDAKAFREDIYKRRIGKPNQGVAYQEGLVQNWVSAKNIQADIVINQHFKAESLKRYPVVVVPHDRAMTEGEFAELKKYVAGGGTAYVDGQEFPFAAFLKAGAEKVSKGKDWEFWVLKHGEGRFVYSEKAHSEEKHKLGPGHVVRKLLKELSGKGEILSIEDLDGRGMMADGFVRKGEGNRWMLGTFAKNAPGGTNRTYRVKLGIPKGEDTWVLDVKNGKRFKYTGEFEYEQPAPGTCWFLIGDGEFTKVPEVRAAAAADGFGALQGPAAVRGAQANIKAREENMGFKPAQGVVATDAIWNGNIQRIARAKAALIGLTYFTPGAEKMKKLLGTDDIRAWREKNRDARIWDAKEFKEELRFAKFLQVRCGKELQDEIFGTCGEELKELLARGGTIMFDKQETSGKAREFLAGVGVEDPNATGRDRKGGDTGARPAPDGEPMPEIFRGKCHWLQYRSSFKGWSAKQTAPYRTDSDPTRAILVIQEKVNGEGKVVFSENVRAFQDFYESIPYGEKMYTFILGEDVKEHKRKAELRKGGVGEPVERE